MLRLIRGDNMDFEIIETHLHSNMLRLIHQPSPRFSSEIPTFTFQYVKINTDFIVQNTLLELCIYIPIC